MFIFLNPNFIFKIKGKVDMWITYSGTVFHKYIFMMTGSWFALD